MRKHEKKKLIRTAREVNNYKTDWVIGQIKLAAAAVNAKSGNKPKIACLGLAFKPDIDDLRESPALLVAESLKSQGYDVVAVEPNIESHDLFELIDLPRALEQADVLAVLVKHRDFIGLTIEGSLSQATVLDFCGLLGLK